MRWRVCWCLRWGEGSLFTKGAKGHEGRATTRVALRLQNRDRSSGAFVVDDLVEGVEDAGEVFLVFHDLFDGLVGGGVLVE